MNSLLNISGDRRQIDVVSFVVLSIGLCLGCASPLWGQLRRFEIDSEKSWARIVEGVPPNNPVDPVSEGSRALFTMAAIPQFEGSFEGAPTGFLTGISDDSQFLLTGGSIGFIPDSDAEFLPLAGLGESPSEHNVAAGMDHVTRGILLKFAIRDLNFGVLGEATLGETVEDTSFEFVSGTMDYQSPFVPPGFLDLTTITPVKNSSQQTLQGDGEASVELPVLIDAHFSVLNEDDSRIIIEANIIANRTLVGDFNGNKSLDAGDIDLIRNAITLNAPDLNFDLDGDGKVALADLDAWVTGIYGSLPGDTDLNRAIDFADFLVLSSNFGKPGGWMDGNFDSDAIVGFPDFLALSSNFGATVPVSAVPEPLTVSRCLVACLLMFWFTQRRPTSNP